MDPQLLIFNIGHVLFILIVGVLGVVVLLRNKKHPVNITFFLSSVAVVTIQATHLIGFNVGDSELSRSILMFSLMGLYVVVFTTNFVFAMLNKLEEKRNILVSLYIASTILLIFFLYNSDKFLTISSTKQYFPNYYNVGSLHWIFLVYFIGVVIYFFYHLIKVYRTSKDPYLKSKIKYVLIGLVVSYVSGPFAFLLAYGIQANPIIAIFTGFYSIPFSYAILKYQLMDINIIAKQAVIYTGIVVAVALGINGVSFSNEYIAENIPNFPRWLFPALSALATVAVGGFVWNKFRTSDKLKYEFVNVVTHKFRTPLTQIKWALENIDGKDPDERVVAKDTIRNANQKMVELTDILVGINRVEQAQYAYNYRPIHLQDIVASVTRTVAKKIQEKGIVLKTEAGVGLPKINGDVERLEYAIHVVIENAVVYTSKGGKILITLDKAGPHVSLVVRDSGIGLSRDDISHIFSKFFRSDEARSIDTEGMGVDLFSVKKIINRHDGSISVYSAGLGKGTSFIIKIPALVT